MKGRMLNVFEGEVQTKYKLTKNFFCFYNFETLQIPPKRHDYFVDIFLTKESLKKYIKGNY